MKGHLTALPSGSKKLGATPQQFVANRRGRPPRSPLPSEPRCQQHVAIFSINLLGGASEKGLGEVLGGRGGYGGGFRELGHIAAPSSPI